MQPRPYGPDELSEMLDEYDAICEETHPEKKGAVARAGESNGSADIRDEISELRSAS
jgi:hypothetical protein